MPPKRKRADRSAGDAGGSRPSPHRPGDTTLGQHDRNYQENGTRYGGRGGGRNSRRGGDRRESAQSSASSNLPTSLNPVSPTAHRPSSASSHAAPTPITPAHPAPSAPSSPAPAVSGYDYNIITDDRIVDWAKNGRQEIIDYGIQSRDDEDITELSTIFQELLQSTVDHRLKAADAGSLVKDILGNRSDEAGDNLFTFDPHTLFLDTVSIFMDVETVEYRPELRDFMVATNISPLLMRKILEPSLLEQLGLIRDTFTKIGIRQVTNILYRQANYNLLREETEGYSKLTTELFTTSNAEPPSSEAVQAAFERVKGLIGTFDLDVGRSLDVTLDVFAAVLIKQFRFFVKFLRISSWWPRNQPKVAATTYVGGLPKWSLPESSHWMTSEEDEAILAEQRLNRDIEFWDRARQIHLDAYFELGGRQVPDNELQRLQDLAAATSEGVDGLDPETQWILTTKTLPPGGNRVAAQLLGFKLRFYDSDFKDRDDILPANLFYMAALLIKIGFMSLCDLYPHVSPFDDKMEELRELRMKELLEEEREKSGGAFNALSQLGVLPDDEKDVARTNKLNADLRAQEAATTGPVVKGPSNFYQKVRLLTELLTVGAVPESLFILGRFPWLPEAFPELWPFIHRLLDYSIDKVFQDCRPVSANPAFAKEGPLKKVPEQDQSAKGTVKLTQVTAKRALRWPHPDGEKDGQPYRCYWDEWADNVPICQTVDDVFTLCGTLLNVSGVNIGKDAALLSKLASIGAKNLTDDNSPENRARWQDLLKRLLVPALSLSQPNASVVNAVWNLLKLYPTPVRYNIYAEWYDGQTSRLPAIRAAFARTRSETKRTLKRLSLQNLSSMARRLSKTAYTSPGVVFKESLSQIEAYDNLIQAFVECARYFTDLGYDVLVWSLMSSLGGGTRSRTQAESVLLTSKWLRALAKFSGQVFKRYSNMKSTPVLQYVNDQLSKGNSTDLVILRELITNMAGIVQDADFTDAQLKAMTGGDVLRRQTLISLGDKRYESTRGARRLMQSLVDTKLAGRLLINLAQYRQSAIYALPDDEANIKYLATIMDESHEALTQYLELLRSNLSPEQFDALIPGVIELMQAYGLDVSLAFMICRVSLQHHMTSPKSPGLPPVKDSQVQQIRASQDVDGDIAMNGSAEVVSETVDDKMVLDDKDATGTPMESSAPSTVLNGRKSDPFTDVLQPIIDGIRATKTSDVWERMSPDFYVMFWSLQLGDLNVPQASYEIEHDRLNKEAEDVMKDRSDMTRSGMNRKDEKKRAFLDIAKSIREEMKNHVERYQKTRFRLAKQSKIWFPTTSADFAATCDTILEQCIMPRLLISASDTEYCFRMIKFLHENRAPNFKLFTLYERFFSTNRLRSLIFSCTVREAEYLGRFIRLVLEDLTRWHWDKNVYEKEALGQKGSGSSQSRNALGFATAFDEEGKPSAFVEHPAFQDSHFEWHKNLNIALKHCLAGMEWMHIRNAITVLKVTTDFFPAINFMGKQLLEQLDVIKTREAATKGKEEAETGEGPRVDLSVTAQTAFSALKKREPKWVMVQAFRSNMSGRNQEGPKGGEPSSRTTTPSNLRPTAAEFQPQQSSNHAQPAEEEDGEVDDRKDPAKGAAATTVSKSDVPADESGVSSRHEPKEASASATTKENVASAVTKPSTPKPSSATPATVIRPEVAKPPPVSGQDRNVHGLPQRPEVPLPGRVQVDRFGQVTTHERREPAARDSREVRDAREPREPRDHRESRDVRDGREPRDYRASDTSRPERPRNFPQERRGPESAPREPGRPSERDWAGRADHLPRRGDHGPLDREARPTRDHSGPNSVHSLDSRPLREDAANAATPATSTQGGLEEPPMNPERAALFRDDNRPEIINPQRAAMIEDGRGPPRSPRDAARERGERLPSRGQSPRRSERYHGDIASAIPPRDERHSRSHYSDHPGPSRDSRGEPPHPQGRDRNFDRDSDRTMPDRGREFPESVQPRHHEADHSRMGQQDPNYGRLNPVPSVPDIPSGPRGPRGRNSTRFPSLNVPPRPDGRFPAPDTNQPRSDEPHPPTGPSSSRQRRGQQPGQFEPVVNSPTSAAAAPPGHGVHPDRARLVGSGGPAQGGPEAVHPERLGHIAPTAPLGQHPHSRPNITSGQPGDRAPPVGTPGPRATPGTSATTPVSESIPLYATPTGPASSNERMRTGGRQIAGINSTLQQSGQSERGGRGGSSRRGPPRMSLPGSDAQVLTAPSPVSTPGYERQDPIRHDINPDRALPTGEPSGLPPRDPRTGTNGDDYPSSRGDHERSGRRDHRERSDRSNRPSRRSSKERSPQREREPKEAREYRDRRSGQPNPSEDVGGRDAGREHVPSRRSSVRDTTGGNREPPPGVGRDPNGNAREPRPRGEGRGDGGNNGRPNEEWTPGSRGGPGRGSGGGMRDSGARLGDDSRGARGDDRPSRKRRSGEEMPTDREKRPRR